MSLGVVLLGVPWSSVNVGQFFAGWAFCFFAVLCIVGSFSLIALVKLSVPDDLDAMRFMQERGFSYIIFCAASAGVLSVHLGVFGMISSALYSSRLCRYGTSLQLSICCGCPASIGVDQSFIFSVQLFGRSRLSMMPSACSCMQFYWQSMSKSASHSVALLAIWLRQSSIDQFADIEFLFSECAEVHLRMPLKSYK